MAIVNLNKKLLEKKTGKITDKLRNRISMMGCPIEAETPEEIQVDITPNRPDFLSQQGIERSLLTFIGKKKGLRKYTSKKSGYQLIVEKSLPKEWPYAFACIVKGLKFDDEKIKEVIQIQEKLGSTLLRNRKKGGIGLYPLEKIKFPVKFIGMHPDKIKFRPLEFPKEITGRQILQKHPTGRDYASICEKWSKLPVFVDKSGKLMSMPPIINSHDMGKINESTTEVFVEVTGTDFNILQKALTIMVTTLADLGGDIYSIDCVQQNKKKITIPNLIPEKMKISTKNVNKLLGLELKDKDVKKFLEMMGHDYSNGTVSIPSYRVDVLHEVDLIEDIAIAYGYENFNETIPNVSTIANESKIEVLKNKIAEVLIGLDLLETYSHSITTYEDECKKMHTKKELIHLSEAKTNYKDMRATMLPSLMKILSNNRDVDYPHRIFEIGKVFEKRKNEITEKTNLALTLTNSNFTEVRQVLEYLAQMLDLKVEFKETTHDSLIEGRTAKVFINKQEVGIIGEVHPKVISDFRLLVPVAAFELELDKVLKLI
ncbi:phenylalanine--tRNA ligase subunit beta [Nanoarchaeota archaeon]